MSVTVNETVNKVIVEEERVRVVTVGTQGPQGIQGPPGDLDEAELQAIVDTSIATHEADTLAVHGIPDTSLLATQDDLSTHESDTLAVHGIPDTSVLATQDDLANLEPLPAPTQDGDVLTLAAGEPTWATPDAGGLDPAGEETITGDWLFDRENVRIGKHQRLAIGIGANATNAGSIAIGVNTSAWTATLAIGHLAGANGSLSDSVLVGAHAGRNSVGNPSDVVALGLWAGCENTVPNSLYLGNGAGRANDRKDRLIVDFQDGSPPAINLATPLIDGRFHAGTDGDGFVYTKGMKVNGIFEPTGGTIYTSPDGTRWKVTIDDAGRLTSEVTTDEITPAPV